MKKVLPFLLLLFVIFNIYSESDYSDSPYFRARVLIEDNLLNNVNEIQNIAFELNPMEKAFLLTDFKKTAVQPLVWNLLLPFGVGSFLYDDKIGGWTIFTGDLLSMTLFTIGYAKLINYESNNSYYNYYTSDSELAKAERLLLIGGIVYLVNDIIKIVRPIVYTSRYNRALKSAIISEKRFNLSFVPDIGISSDNQIEPVISFKLSI